jgi:hypothetical protein
MFNIEVLKLYSATTWIFSETVKGATLSDKLFLSVKSLSGDISTQFESDASMVNGGCSYKFIISKNDTNLFPGFYTWQLVLENGDDSRIIGSGAKEIFVNADSADQSGVTDFWLAQVQNLREMIDKLNKMTTTEVTFAGRTYRYKDVKQLYEHLLFAERQAGIKKPTPRIFESY